MKFLKAILIVVLLSISALTLISVFVPEVDGQFSMEVQEQRTVVFSSMVNPGNLTEWVDNLQKVEYPGTPTDVLDGKMELHFQSKETSEIYTLELKKVVPLEQVQFKLYNDMLVVDGSIKFEKKGPSTKVETYLQLKGKGFISKAFIPLMSNVVMDAFQRDFENFKEFQEQQR